MTPKPPERDMKEAVRDLDYVIRLSQRHHRLYKRYGGLLRFLELFGGSAAVAAAFSGSPLGLKVAGMAVAAVAAANLAFDPAETARRHAECGRSYAALRAKALNMTDYKKLDIARAAICDPDYIEALRVPSWKEMMRAHGFETPQIKLSWFQRLVSALA